MLGCALLALASAYAAMRAARAPPRPPKGDAPPVVCQSGVPDALRVLVQCDAETGARPVKLACAEAIPEADEASRVACAQWVPGLSDLPAVDGYSSFGCWDPARASLRRCAPPLLCAAGRCVDPRGGKDTPAEPPVAPAPTGEDSGAAYKWGLVAGVAAAAVAATTLVLYLRRVRKRHRRLLDEERIQVQQLESSTASLQQELNQLQRLHKLQDKLRTEDIRQSQHRLEQVQALLDELSARSETFTTALSGEWTKHAQQLQEELRARDQTIQGLHEKARANETRIAELTRKSDRLMKDIRRQKSTLDASESVHKAKVKDLQEQIRNQREQAEAQGTRAAELERETSLEVARLSTALQTEEEARRAHKQALAQLEEERQTIQRELSAREQELRTTRQQLQATADEKSNIEHELQMEAAARATFEQKLRDEKEERSKVEQALRREEEGHKAATYRAFSAEVEMEKLRMEWTIDEERHRRVELNLERVNGELQESRRQLHAANQKWAEAQARLSAAAADLQRGTGKTNSRLEDALRDLQESQERVVALEKSHLDLESQLRALSRENWQLQGKLEAELQRSDVVLAAWQSRHEQQVGALQSQVRDLQQREMADGLLKEAQEAMLAIVRVEGAARVDLARQATAHALDQLERAQAALASLGDRDRTIVSLRVQLNDLRDKLTEKEGELVGAQTAASRAKAAAKELEEARAKMAQGASELGNVKAQLEQLQRENKALADEKLQLQQQVAHLQAAAQSELQAARERARAAEEQLSAEWMDKARLAAMNQQWQETYRQAHHWLTSMNADRADARYDKQEAIRQLNALQEVAVKQQAHIDRQQAYINRLDNELQQRQDLNTRKRRRGD